MTSPVFYVACLIVLIIGIIVCVQGGLAGKKLKTVIGTVMWIGAIIIAAAALPRSGAKTPEVNTDVSFEEIYAEYKSNESRANEEFKGNRYRITAIINGISDGGFLDSKNAANLTLEKDIDETTVFFYATFKDKNEIMDYNVGDEITFDGTYSKAGSWYDCTVVE